MKRDNPCSSRKQQIADLLASYLPIYDPFDLVFLSADAVGLIPVNLRAAEDSVAEPNLCEALPLSPAAGTVNLLEPHQLPNASSGGDCFNASDLADNGEMHPRAKDRT